MDNELPKHTTLMDLLSAMRDYNIAASELNEPGREPYKGAADELTVLITLLSGEQFANTVIRTPKVISAYTNAISRRNHLLLIK